MPRRWIWGRKGRRRGRKGRGEEEEEEGKEETAVAAAGGELVGPFLEKLSLRGLEGSWF